MKERISRTTDTYMVEVKGIASKREQGTKMNLPLPPIDEHDRQAVEQREREIRRLFRDEQGRLQVAKIIQASPMPIYGVAGRPLGLRVTSVLTGHTLQDARIKDVIVHFAKPPIRSGYHLEITSFATKGAYPPWENAPSWLPPWFGPPHEHAKVRAEIGEPQTSKEMLLAEGVQFSVDLLFWTHPRQVAAFYLEHEDTALFGQARDLSQEELLDALKQLVSINNRPELIAQYQSELDVLADAS
jgi:hypothetical protein